MNTIKHRILDNIETLINQQTAKGVETYGHTLDDCPHDKYDWQQMIIEELIDALQYQQKELSHYRKTLEFYADGKIYSPHFKLDIMKDCGDYARKTLEERK